MIHFVQDNGHLETSIEFQKIFAQYQKNAFVLAMHSPAISHRMILIAIADESKHKKTDLQCSSTEGPDRKVNAATHAFLSPIITYGGYIKNEKQKERSEEREVH